MKVFCLYGVSHTQIDPMKSASDKTYAGVRQNVYGHVASAIAGGLAYYSCAAQNWLLLGAPVGIAVVLALNVGSIRRPGSKTAARELDVESTKPGSSPPRSDASTRCDMISFCPEELIEKRASTIQQLKDQAGIINATATHIEHMASSVREGVDNAQKASKLASNASSIAAKGADAVSTAGGTMTMLSESAGKIADITSVIDSIAFQTNILALNAAVEAARAGEQGKGFAVVATEVRNLAHRSAAAAKDIKNLIQSSVTQIDAGVDLVNEAGKSMQAVMHSVLDVAAIVQHIANEAESQSMEAGEVMQAVHQMRDANTATMKLLQSESSEANPLSTPRAQLQSDPEAVRRPNLPISKKTDAAVSTPTPASRKVTAAPRSNLLAELNSGTATKQNTSSGLDRALQHRSSVDAHAPKGLPKPDNSPNDANDHWVEF